MHEHPGLVTRVLTHLGSPRSYASILGGITMPVMITCPSCGRSMKGPDSVIGKTVKCPACQTQFAVTGGPAPAPEPEPMIAALADDESEPVRQLSREPGRPSAFMEFLSFRRMIAPLIIQIVFWILAVIAFIAGLITAVVSILQIGNQGAPALLGVLIGLAYAVLGPLILRVYAEVVIVFFRMYETMREVRDGIDRLKKEP